MIRPMTSRHRSPPPSGQPVNHDLLIKGILCALIGLGVLISPAFISSPGMQGIVANASLVGWFALVLGCAFIVLYLVRRSQAASK